LFPNAVLTVHEGVGHYPWVEEPAEVSKRVAAFLED
jgi:hypothetical protein